MAVPAGRLIIRLRLPHTMSPLAQMVLEEYVSGSTAQAAQMEISIMLKEMEEVLHGETKLYLYPDNTTAQLTRAGRSITLQISIMLT